MKTKLRRMECFGDISKYNNQIDDSFNRIISRFERYDSNHIIISESIHLVAKYETTNGLNPIESISFPELRQLSFPVIVDNNSIDEKRHIIALQESNLLTKWSFDMNPNKRRVEKNWFKTKIIALISFSDEHNAHNPIEPIVVFENGFCQSITNAIKTKREDLKRRVIATDEVIQYAEALIDNQFNENLNIYLITKIASNKSKSYSSIKSIYKLIINRETDDILKIESQSVGNDLKHWSLCRHLSSLLAISQTNDELIVYSLDGKTERLLHKLKSTAIKRVISFGTTSNGSICLIGKTTEGNDLLELWETRYGTKLGQICLPYEPLVNDCKVIDDMIYITGYKGFISIPIKIQNIYLSQIVGKITNNSYLELNQNNLFKQICADFELLEDHFDDIYERLSQALKQMNGNIPEDLILQLINICSLKLIKSNSDLLKNMFNQLVCLPFNDVFMISKLKASALTFDQILLSLQLLTDLLPSNNCAIIDWMCILIDSYMSSFIINPNENTIKVIKLMSDRVEYLSQFYEQLDEIKNLFDIIMSNNKKSSHNNCLNLPKPKRGQYCIELLRI